MARWPMYGLERARFRIVTVKPVGIATGFRARRVVSLAKVGWVSRPSVIGVAFYFEK